MEVRIGVVHTPKELTLDLGASPEEAVKMIDDALKDAGTLLWLTDSKGHRVGVALDKLAYIEIESEEGSKRVGFGSI
jgi:hypothetical protein